ncbi:hypothetical protein AX16_008346 [Volvariella volvacea WC 439]|nr:hypothetical protein AX16_008346 [Volvariella volvacea WC 439]
MPPRKPLLSFDDITRPRLTSTFSPSSDDEDTTKNSKRWYHYLPLCGTLFFILLPQPSIILSLTDYYLQVLHKPINFIIHIGVIYTLTFMILSSLIVCIVRDPGSVLHTSTRSRFQEGLEDDTHARGNGRGRNEEEEIELSQALMTDDDFSAPWKWCRKCWAPKPERTHHCSTCGRCVLKMDHHCPWLGGRCVGHRTYPAFVHFLFCITALSIYTAVLSISGLLWSFSNPYSINEVTPIHQLFLSAMGCVFALVIGSFFCYHVYLILTNQTTLEHISPFLLLKYLPPLPENGHSLSSPPLEPELTYAQRRLVKDAHGCIRRYDVGWKKNVAQVFGCKRKIGWAYRAWYGGSSPGDGRIFPYNPRSDEMLARLATELVKLDKNR